jgi:hypothetical protein
VSPLVLQIRNPSLQNLIRSLVCRPTRYLNSHQQQVTVILAYLVQACHDLVPPEELIPVIKNVANNFVAGE